MPAIAQQVGRGAMSEQAAATNDARDSSCREREEPKLTRPTAGDYDRARSSFSVMSGFAPPHLRIIARLCSGRLTLRLPTRLGSRFGATGLGARLDSTRLFAARFCARLDAAGLFAPWLDLSRLALPWVNLPWLSATRLIARRQDHPALAAVGVVPGVRGVPVVRGGPVVPGVGVVRMGRDRAAPGAPSGVG